MPSDQIAAQARKVLFVLVEQDPQHPVRRDQPQEPAVGVDHSQAGFVVVHHSPSGALLVGVWRHLRRVRVHDVLDAGVRVGGQKRARSRPARPASRVEYDDILGALELVPWQLPPDLCDALVTACHRDARGCVLGRDAQQSVRRGSFSRSPQGSPLTNSSPIA